MTAPQFQPNHTGSDSYKTFKYRIKWDGKYVAGVSKVTGLTRTSNVVLHCERDVPSSSHISPGQTDYGAITLERGVTYDLEFETWVNTVWDFANSPGEQQISLKDFRKDIVIELYNEAGQKVMAYTVYRCWASESTVMPELDAGGNAVAIQSIKLENEGWERDTSVAEPAEPGL